MIANVLARSPRLFSCCLAENLTPKLEWFYAKGLSNAKMSRVIFNTPALLSITSSRNESQLFALQSMGLSGHQVSHLLKTKPQLLTMDMSGVIVQAKMQFLIEVMQKHADDMIGCPEFLTYSLHKRIGPRWFFFCLHCKGKAFKLSQLKLTDIAFVKRLCSASLSAACSFQGQTRLQLFEEFKNQWQQGEGGVWDVRNQSKFPKLHDIHAEDGVLPHDKFEED